MSGDLLIKLFFLLIMGFGCVAGGVLLQRSFRRGGSGPALPLLLLIAAGSAVSLALSERNFLTGEIFQSAIATKVTQAATIALLLVGGYSVLSRAPRLIKPMKDPAFAIWAGFLAFFFLDTILGSMFGAVRSFPIASVYSVLIFTAVFVWPPATERQFALAAKAAPLLVLYLSALKALADPYSVVEQPYVGLLPGIDSRYHGVTGHANILGPVALSYLIFEYAYPSRALYRALNGTLAFITLLLAQSKTAWVGALGLTAVVLYFSVVLVSTRRMSPFVRQTVKALFLIVVLPLMLVLIAQQVFEVIQLSGKERELSTFTGRTLIWQITYEKFLENPLFGYGPTLWDEGFRFRYHLPYVGQAHNQFLQTLGTGGLVGFVGLLGYFFFLVWATIRHASVTRGATIAFLLMFLFHAFSEAPMRLTAVLSGGSLLHLSLFVWLVFLCRNIKPQQRAVANLEAGGNDVD